MEPDRVNLLKRQGTCEVLITLYRKRTCIRAAIPVLHFADLNVIPAPIHKFKKMIAHYLMPLRGLIS